MKNKFWRTVSFTLLFSLLLTAIFSLAVYSDGGNYSYLGATLKTEILATDFIENHLGINLTQTEKEYFGKNPTAVVTYNAKIPTAYVTCNYNSNTEVLTVTAREYTYTAENGVLLVWRPVSAKVGGQTVNFSDSTYTVEITDVSSYSENSVKIKYTAELTVSEGQLNYLINIGPEFKDEAERKMREYEEKLDEYEENVEKYLEYLSAVELYRKYLSEKRIYDEKYAEYSAYLSELKEYNEAKEKHLKYLSDKEKYTLDYAAYLEYLAYASRNQSKIEAYEKYQEKLDTVKAQLGIIKGTKKSSTDLKRNVYSAIMGDTVTSVIENKDAIANNLTGADPKAVDMAGAATENLRVLLKEFFAIKDQNEQYSYYITNYEVFRDNFINLFRSLDKLYMNGKVRGALIMQGKQEKYVILLAQLYYVSNALSDTPVKNYDETGYYNSDYVVGKGYADEKSPKAILGEEYISDTDKATPLEEGYPVAVEKPEYTAVAEPKMPEFVAEPIAPEPVSEPIAPEPVSEPVPADKPGKEPEIYTVPTDKKAVIDAYVSGEIAKREYRVGSVTLTPEITVSKVFVNPETVKVTYYDREYDSPDSKTELYSIEIDKGTYADYMGTIPEKAEDAENKYVFAGWTDAAGNGEIDFAAVSDNMALYPKFESVRKEYQSVWIVEGEEYTEEPENPQKADNGNMCYVFIGWDKESDVSAARVTYTAKFEERYTVPVSDGGADVKFTDGNYVVKTQSYVKRFDISMLTELAYEKGGIVMQTVSGEISFSYTETMKLKEVGARELEISMVQRSSGGYSFAVLIYGENREMIKTPVKVTFKAPCEFEDPSHLILYFEENGEKKLVRNTYENETLNFAATTGTVYYARVEYSATPISTGNVNVSVDKNAATKGEAVKVTIDVPPGIALNRLYYMTQGGEKTDIIDGEFTMPSADINIGVDYTVLEYTVTFISDGKIIAVYKCIYGETVTPPADPKKASDDKFTYTFVGWSDEVLPVTESITYTAVYSAMKIEKNEDKTLKITPSVLKIILLGGSLSVILILAFVPSVTATCILIIKRKKRFLKTKCDRGK